jgi:hypothetical protein
MFHSPPAEVKVTQGQKPVHLYRTTQQLPNEKNRTPPTKEASIEDHHPEYQYPQDQHAVILRSSQVIYWDIYKIIYLLFTIDTSRNYGILCKPSGIPNAQNNPVIPSHRL